MLINNSPQYKPVDSKTGAPAQKRNIQQTQNVYTPKVIREPSINLNKEWELITEVFII